MWDLGEGISKGDPKDTIMPFFAQWLNSLLASCLQLLASLLLIEFTLPMVALRQSLLHLLERQIALVLLIPLAVGA